MPILPARDLQHRFEYFSTFLLTFCLVLLTIKLKKAEALPVWYFKIILFVFLDSYLKHVNKEHPDLVSTLWHLCGICQFHYPTEKALRRHSSVMHKNQKHDAVLKPKPTTTTRRSTTTPEFKCQFCPKKFMQESIWAQVRLVVNPSLLFNI